MKLSRKVLYAILVVLIAGIYLQLTQPAEQEKVVTTEDIVISIEQQKAELKLKQELIAQLEREDEWMKEISCLARNVYYEARGESLEGQKAVALVTLNRVENPMFPDTICGVVNERKVVKGRTKCQFSWRCESHNDPKKAVRQSHESYQAAMTAILDYEILTTTLVTKDTLFFHAKHVRPFWRKVKQRLAQIDNHIFYEQRPGDKRR
jgi:spore germination cell wall hydrolase CwlJ-like protein